MSEETYDDKDTIVQKWRRTLGLVRDISATALRDEMPLLDVDKISKCLGKAIHQIRELVRPEPRTVAFLEEEAWYRMKGEYRTPKAAIDAVMANPPLGDLPPGADGVEPRDTPISPDAPKMERGWPEIFDIPELGIQWRRYYTPRYVHVISAWNDAANAHVYQMTVRPWPLASGERWHVNVTNDGGTVFTMESRSKHLAERCGLAAMRAYIIRGHRKTWRKVRAAEDSKRTTASAEHEPEAQA